MTTFQVGDAIRVERTVRRFGGQPGFVVMVNETGGPAIDPLPPTATLAERDAAPRHPEYGVVLTTHRPPWRKDMPGQLQYDSDAVKWFAPRELTAR